MLVYGINPVLEALRAGKVKALAVARSESRRIAEIVKIAESAGVEIRHVAAEDLQRRTRGGVHQGVAAEVYDAPRLDIPDLLEGISGPALIVVLDQVEDPHNVGAILRSVDAAGAHGVVRQMRHAAPIDGATAKASAGAAAHVRVADVVNVARAVEELKERGVWTVGLAGDAPKRYDEVDWALPTALVVGAEGVGLRRLVRERCDWVVSIPMSGHVQSLNVSVAAGIALFEAARQRRIKAQQEIGRRF